MPTTDHPATEALRPVAARIEAWCRRIGATEALLSDDIAHPMESSVRLWGVSLLPAADMGEAARALAEVSAGLVAVRALAAALTGPSGAAMGPLQAEAAGKQIEHRMWLVKSAIRRTIDGVRRANMAVADRDQMVADTALEADTFVVDKAPEVVGDIVAALSASKQAGALVENLGKVALRGVTEASYVLQGGTAGGLDEQIGSIQDKALDAAIDLAASFVPAANDSIRAAVRNLCASAVKGAFKAAKGKSGPALEAALISGVQDGVLAGLEGLAKEIPGLKDDKLRQKIMTPLIKAMSGAAKALMKGTSVADGFATGMVKGAVSAAAGLGKEKIVGHGEAHGAAGIGPEQQRQLQDAYVRAVFGIDMRVPETVR